MPNRFRIQDPPRDAAGAVQPHDHPDIDGGLLRHIDPEHHIIPDENEGRRRISSLAFKASSDGTGMSVDIENLLAADGLPLDCHVPLGWGLVRLQAGFCRSLDLRVGWYPLPDKNEHHGAVWGIPKKGSVRDRLRKEAERDWVKRIPGVP